MLAQTSGPTKARLHPVSLVLMILLPVILFFVLLGLIIFKPKANSVVRTNPAQNQYADNRLILRVMDLTYVLPADLKNPMRTKPQVITTREAAQALAEQIAKRLKDNPGLSDQQIASLSAGKLPLSFYSTRPATGSAQLPGSVTVSLLKEGVIRITQLLMK